MILLDTRMLKRKIGACGLETSRIGLGCVTLGREIDEPQSFRALDYAFERGINLVDTAPLEAIHPVYNLVRREIGAEILPFCQQSRIQR